MTVIWYSRSFYLGDKMSCPPTGRFATKFRKFLVRHFEWRQEATERKLEIMHYNDVIMGVIASQITSLAIVYSIVYSDADQRKHQCSASLAFVWGINRGPVNSPHKWPVTREMFPFDDVIMCWNTSNSVVSIVAVDDGGHSCARASASTMMTKVWLPSIL